MLDLKQVKEENNHLRKPSTHTKFSANFEHLFANLIELYPGFQRFITDINSKMVPDEVLKAENVYKQLNFLYKQGLEHS